MPCADGRLFVTHLDVLIVVVYALSLFLSKRLLCGLLRLVTLLLVHLLVLNWVVPLVTLSLPFILVLTILVWLSLLLDLLIVIEVIIALISLDLVRFNSLTVKQPASDLTISLIKLTILHGVHSCSMQIELIAVFRHVEHLRLMTHGMVSEVVLRDLVLFSSVKLEYLS